MSINYQLDHLTKILHETLYLVDQQRYVKKEQHHKRQ